MEIVTYEEVGDYDMSELTLACFNHPYSWEHIRGMIRADCRLPPWGGELYAVEKGEVLGTCGMLYPRIIFDSRRERVGGIRNVCVRNSASGRGVATELLREAHARFEDQGIGRIFLMTSRSGIAHSLYRTLGYEDIHVYPVAFKAIEKVESDVGFETGPDNHMVRKLYLESVQGLEGLIVREKGFEKMAQARGWPDNNDLHIAHHQNESIGYAMFKEGRKSIICQEMAGDVKDIIEGLERMAQGRYLVFQYVNPLHRSILENMGYRYSTDQWQVVMMRSLDNHESFRGNFHNGIYESY